jgi:hypothetical protein
VRQTRDEIKHRVLKVQLPVREQLSRNTISA